MIDSKPAPSPEVICFKTSVMVSKNMSTGSGDSGALSLALLKLDRIVRRKWWCAFSWGRTPKQKPKPQDQTKTQTLSPILNGAP